MKNGKPCNLFPLLKAVRHPLGRNQKAYETHFCNGALKNFGKGSVWDASGCSNLAQLKQLVASNLLHMTKEQCLSDLPPLTNIPHHVPVSSRFQIQYERCVKDLVRVNCLSLGLPAKGEVSVPILLVLTSNIFSSHHYRYRLTSRRIRRA